MQNLFSPETQWCLDTQILTKKETQRVLEMCGIVGIKWSDGTNAVNFLPKVRYLHFGSIKNRLTQTSFPKYNKITYEDLLASFIEHHSKAQEAPTEIVHPTVPIGTIVLLTLKLVKIEGFAAYYIESPTTTRQVFDWALLQLKKSGVGAIITNLRYIEPPKPQR